MYKIIFVFILFFEFLYCNEINTIKYEDKEFEILSCNDGNDNACNHLGEYYLSMWKKTYGIKTNDIRDSGQSKDCFKKSIFFSNGCKLNNAKSCEVLSFFILMKIKS